MQEDQPQNPDDLAAHAAEIAKASFDKVVQDPTNPTAFTGEAASPETGETITVHRDYSPENVTQPEAAEFDTGRAEARAHGKKGSEEELDQQYDEQQALDESYRRDPVSAAELEGVMQDHLDAVDEIDAKIEAAGSQAGEEYDRTHTVTDTTDEVIKKPIKVRRDFSKHVGEEGRWDNDKAETMAAVVEDSGMVDYALEEGTTLVKGLQRPEPLLPPKNIFEPTHNELRKKLGELGDQITQITDKKLSPHAELYDLNPEKFASMPTSEFMDTAKELATLDETVKYDERAKQEIAICRNSFMQADRDRQPVSVRSLEEFARLIYSATSPKDEDPAAEAHYAEYDQVLEAIKAIDERSYDQPPRQTHEEYKKLVDPWLDKFVAKRDADLKARQDFLDSQRPSEQPTEPQPEQQ